MSAAAQPIARSGDGLRVADLVAMPHLGIHVLAGADGLDRLIEWTHVSELPDPAPWLEGGEMLIVNGFGVPKSGAEQALYVGRLAERRVAALAVGRLAPPLQQEMLDAADRLGLPLLRLPKATPFVAISHLVANANQHPAQRRLVRNLQILDTLRLRDGVRGGTRERFAELEKISGYRLALISVAGEPVLAEWPWVPDGLDVGALVEDGEGRIVIEGGYALPVPVGQRIAAFLVAVEQPGSEAAGLSALQHIATVAALELLEEYRRREARRRSGAEALAELLAGRLTAEQALERLSSEGLPAGAPLALVAFRGSAEPVDDEELHHTLCDRAIDHLMLQQDELFVLMPDSSEALETIVGELDVSAGVSASISDLARLAVARRETLWSLAGAGGVAGRVVRFAADDSFAHWFPADLDALALMVEAALGPIIDYDEGHGTELLKSLVVFFANQRKLRRAAGELFVHEHTLAYRLKRIEAVTGRDLSDLQDTSELWLALKALPVVQGRREEAQR